jgi:hypothetical protein
VTPRRRLRALVALAAVAALAACAPVVGGGPTTVSTAPSSIDPADSGFIAFGDAGTGEPTQHQVADQMEQWVAAGHRVDALIEAGDQVYPTGDPSRFDATIREPYADLVSAARPLWVALGNHDVIGGHGDEQLAYLGLPSLPYTTSLPGLQLLFLDANRPDAAQAQWLDDRLSEPGPALRVVVFHQPAYSCALHGSDEAVQSEWVPVLERHEVALVINGHDHYYERFRSADDVTYVVTGGGGNDLYARRTFCAVAATPQATATRHHFIAIEVRGSVLTLTAVARTGEVLDQTVITR